MLDHLKKLREQQAGVVEEACQALEKVLTQDPYLRGRLSSCTVDSHSKALYSLHRSAAPPRAPCAAFLGCCLRMAMGKPFLRSSTFSIVSGNGVNGSGLEPNTCGHLDFFLSIYMTRL